MYIIDHKKQIAMIGEMKQIRKDSKSFEVYYHHPLTNQVWKSFFPKSDGKDLGPKLLRHEPLPTSIEECLHICMSEDAPENAIGLGIEWSTKPELWDEIMATIEKEYSSYDRTQLKLFLKHLDLKQAKEFNFDEEASEEQKPPFSYKEAKSLIWRSRKVRMKRIFSFG